MNATATATAGEQAHSQICPHTALPALPPIRQPHSVCRRICAFAILAFYREAWGLPSHASSRAKAVDDNFLDAADAARRGRAQGVD